jgi:hypothetical protein
VRRTDSETQGILDLPVLHPGGTEIANLHNKFRRQHGLSVAFTEGVSSLRDHICDIVGIGSDEEVRRIHAHFQIAMMKNTRL